MEIGGDKDVLAELMRAVQLDVFIDFYRVQVPWRTVLSWAGLPVGALAPPIYDYSVSGE
jgi:hypothetical protein